MELVAAERGADLVVRIEDDRLDAVMAVRFKDEMRALAGGVHPRVILDLSQVDFLDSSGLGALVAVLKEVGSGRSFVLTGLTSNVEKVFRLTRMDSVFTIYPDVDTAFGGVAHAS